MSETLLRLALLGTAIGFILMLIPISGLDPPMSTGCARRLTGMTDGAATRPQHHGRRHWHRLILKFEYYLLDEAIADLFREVNELTEVHVVPVLGNRPPAINGLSPEEGGDVPRA